jgi:hypothetical protein
MFTTDTRKVPLFSSEGDIVGIKYTPTTKKAWEELEALLLTLNFMRGNLTTKRSDSRSEVRSKFARGMGGLSSDWRRSFEPEAVSPRLDRRYRNLP